MRSGKYANDWLPSLADLAEVRYDRGQVLQLLSRFDDAMAEAERAQALAARAGDRELVLQCLAKKSHLCYQTGKLDRGLELAAVVRSQPEAQRYPRHLAQALNAKGNIHLRRCQFEEGAAAFTEARALYDGMGDRLSAALVEHNLANIANIKGACARALEHYRRVLALFREFNDRFRIAHVLASMSQVQWSLGDAAGARISLTESLRIRQAIHDYNGLSSCWLNMANIENESGNPAEGLRDIELGRAIALEHALKDPQRWAVIYGKRAETLQRLGRLDEAVADLRELVRIAEANGFREFIAESYSLMGQIAAQQGDGAGGLELIDKGVALAREHCLDWQLYNGLQGRADCLASLGRADEARGALSECLEMAQRLELDPGPVRKRLAALP